MKAEDKISEVQDRMVEINESERKKEKQIKRNEDNLKRPWGQYERPQHSNHTSPSRRRQREDHEKILEEIIVENFPKMEKEIITQAQETQSSKQGKPKAKHPKTHINQINKD